MPISASAIASVLHVYYAIQSELIVRPQFSLADIAQAYHAQASPPSFSLRLSERKFHAGGAGDAKKGAEKRTYLLPLRLGLSADLIVAWL
jgi:hypothetical protein